jgi:hypothetical protein
MREVLDAQIQFGSLAGRQDAVRGDGTLPMTEATQATKLTGTASRGPGTYKYQLDVGGAATVRAVHKPTTVTTTGGVPTVQLAALLADGVTEDTTVARTSLTVTQGTLAAQTLAVPAGVRYAMLIIVVPASSAIDYSGAGGVAEYSAK